VEKAQHSVQTLCAVLQVSRQGYYAWLKRAPSSRARADAALSVDVRRAHVESHRRYGAPRVHRELRAQGIHVSRKRVARLMRESGLAARRRRRFVRTTQSNHGERVAGNILHRQFDVSAANTVWAGDITYIPTRSGWLYLAVILDLFSRRVVGWSMQPHLERTLVLSALEMALATRSPPSGLLYHSDRGVQYACRDYRLALHRAEITPSMSRKGDCWDNAVVESFFSTLKQELVYERDFADPDEARSAVFEYIEAFYNRTRRHSSLGYVSPAEYEKLRRTA
jgi:putative transposase